MTRRFLTLLLSAAALLAGAQTATGPEMADGFRQDGKIWVVITVIVLVFLALAAFLAVIERRLARLEKDVKDKGL